MEVIAPPARRVLERLERAGYEAYLVGGCVRDLLLDRRPGDWDITTAARPEEVLSLLRLRPRPPGLSTVPSLFLRGRRLSKSPRSAWMGLMPITAIPMLSRSLTPLPKI